MRLNVFLLLGALALPLLFSWAMSYTAPSASVIASPSVQAEEKLPDFDFTDLAGKAHHSVDFRGRVMLLNFWASWCAPCIREFPGLRDIARRNPDITIVALSLDDGKKPAEKFLKKMGTLPGNFIVGLDADQRISHDLFQSLLIPETVIVTPAGMMSGKIAGGSWSASDMNSEIKNAAIKR